jgi:anthranilate phosphoribosyltransferase
LIQQAIGRLVEGHDLSPDEVRSALEEMISGQATQAQIAGLLVALRGKGESADEIASFASTFRGYGIKIQPRVKGRLVDTCGTGGDQAKTFNVSTVSAIVAAGSGVSIAKHGNRSVTSRCGSADLLESLGFNLTMDPGAVQASIEQIGIGFMFAPAFHPAMKQVGPVRRELGIRTIFNLMGPLMNPAGADAQILGVYSQPLTLKVAQAMKKLGSGEAMVIHALEGMDEISVTGRTSVAWLRDGEITEREYSPGDLGVSTYHGGTMAVSSVEESGRIALAIMDGSDRASGRLEMVLVNAAAAIIVAGMARDFAEALPIARDSIESGAAYRKLEAMIRFSGGELRRLESHAASK